MKIPREKLAVGSCGGGDRNGNEKTEQQQFLRPQEITGIRAGDVAHLEECAPSMHETLDFVPSTTEK